MQDMNFLSVVREGDLESVAKFFVGNFDSNVWNHCNESPLIIAVDRKNKALVEFLISKKVNLHVQGFLTGTALTYAIFMEETEIAKLLLGAEEAFSDQKHPGALIWAVQNENKDLILSILKKGGDINCPGLAYYNELNSPAWIWKPMPDPTSSPFHPEYLRQLSYSPLVFAMYYCDEYFVNFLLDDCYANVDLSNPDKLNLVKMARSKEFSDDLILRLERAVYDCSAEANVEFKYI